MADADLAECAALFRPTLPGSEQPAAVRYGVVGRDQHDLVRGVGKAEDEDLGEEFADLPRREIDYRGDLTPGERGGIVVLGELGRRSLASEFRPEIDGQFE